VKKRGKPMSVPSGGFGEPLVDEVEAARLLGVTPRWLQERRIAADGPPWVQCGKYVRYSPGALRIWAGSNTRTSTTGARRKQAVAGT
jgi:hypothetical protein